MSKLSRLANKYSVIFIRNYGKQGAFKKWKMILR